MSDLLRTIGTEALDKGNYNIPMEGLFRSAIRASFVRAYQFAVYCHRVDPDKADEGAFFMASSLRGTCEDLITLKFIRQLKAKDRNEVISIEMRVAVNKALVEQTKFFRKKRPFQLVLTAQEEDEALVAALRARLYEIGTTSGLWKTDKKLLPIEQMAIKLGMREMYDYFYRVTSDVVHFNPRISLRSGWGDDPKRGKFSMENFAKYYAEFCQVYSVLLFTMLARAFAVDLSLSKPFRAGLSAIETALDEVLRWPEAVTFEEMNQRPPGFLMRLVAKVAHEKKSVRRKLHGEKPIT